MNITPLHDTHAIESVSFGVEWQQPLPPAVMGALESVYEAALKKKLPSKKPVQQFAFEFNLESGGKSIQPAQAVGWTFERFAPDGRIERNLMLTPNTLAVTLHTYTRWEEVYATAADLMHPLLPLIAVSSGGFTVFGLQYQDVFRITGDDVAQFRADMLLRQNSAMLPASVFQQKSLWHAHHGYFTEMPDEPERRKLTVVNTDLIDENGNRQVRILSVHKTVFNSPLSDTEQLYAGDNPPLHAAMHGMHSENKAVLRELLNDDMLARIHLNAEEGTDL